MNKVIYTGVFEEEEIPRGVWKAGCAIVADEALFDSAISATEFNIGVELVYMINSVDTDHPCNVEYDFRIRNGLKELMLVTLRRIEPGQQLLARDYMQKINRKRKHKRNARALLQGNY